MTINADAASYTAGTITINSKTATNFSDDTGGVYTVDYVIANGDNNVADSAQIPISVQLTDSAGNTNTAFTTSPDANVSPGISAQKPVIN